MSKPTEDEVRVFRHYLQVAHCIIVSAEVAKEIIEAARGKIADDS